MVFILVTMLVILVLAGLVLVYVAFPHRGEPMPTAPWLGEAMEKVVAKAGEKMPVVDADESSDWSIRH